MKIFEEIADEVLKGNSDSVEVLTNKALSQDISAEEILNNGLVAGMNVVSEKFKNNEIFIPEVLISAKSMYSGLGIIKPLLAESNVKSKGKVVIGTVKGDLHDIGKNLVITMAEGQGFKVVDLGIDVDYSKFVDAVKEHSPQIVAFSGLLTTTLANIPEHIKALEDAGVRGDIKLAVGGAPVTRDFADRYGIEIYADDASAAAKEFIKAIS